MEIDVGEVVKYGGVDNVPLPFPFRCGVCGRSNAAVWLEEDGRLVLVCKCGADI